MEHFLLNQKNEKVLTVVSLTHESVVSYFRNPNFYGVLFFKKAEGFLIIDDHESQIRDRDILFYYPFQKLSLKGKFEGVLVQFHPDFFCIDIHAKDIGCQGLLFNNVFNDSLLSCTQQEFRGLSQLQARLVKELRHKELAQLDMVACQLKAFLISAVRIMTGKQLNEFDYKEHSHNRLEQLIDHNFDSESSPEFYAKSLGVSQTTFNRLCKRYFQQSFITILNLKRVAMAKNKLFLSEMAVKEIAYEVGFTDPLYFSRVFKKHAGVTPTEFRVQLKSNRLV